MTSTILITTQDISKFFVMSKLTDEFPNYSLTTKTYQSGAQRCEMLT